MWDSNGCHLGRVESYTVWGAAGTGRWASRQVGKRQYFRAWRHESQKYERLPNLTAAIRVLLAAPYTSTANASQSKGVADGDQRTPEVALSGLPC